MTAFSESAQAELMRLGDGDAVSIQGVFKAELYQPEGSEPKLSLSIIADQVLTLRQPPKERKAPDWWRREPKSNIGIVTGAGHFVIDLDDAGAVA